MCITCSALPTTHVPFPWTTDFFVEPVHGTKGRSAGSFEIVKTKRCIDNTTTSCDPGWGVDLTIRNNASAVTSVIGDTDGDAFFQVTLSGSHNYCKVDTGSNGLGPGASVEIFEMKGLSCAVRQMPVEGKYVVVLEVSTTHKEDCKSYGPGEPSNTCPGPIMLGTASL